MFFSRLASAAFLSVLVASPVAAQPQAVTIGVFSFGFSPKPIRLRAGQPVTLTFVNQSGSSHDFSAHRFFANSTITAGAAPEGEIDLAPHQTKSVTLVPRTGTYPAHCRHFMHSTFGMKDEIVVN